MAHGAGGKATQSMIEGLFEPAFGAQTAEDAAALEIGGAALAFTTDSFVVKPLRFPGGSIGDLAVNGTVNDLAVSGARPRALTLSLILEEGLAADDLKAEVEAIAAAAQAAQVDDRRRRHQGRRARRRRRHVHLHGRHRRARSACPAGGRLDPPGRPHPPLRHDRRARHGDHARARRVRARRGHRVRHALAVAGRGRAARGGRPVAPLHARRDARRRGLGAERARPQLAAWRCSCARRACRSTRRWPARPRSWESTRCTSRTRASSSPSSRRRAADGALAALRSVPGCERAAEIGEVRTEPPGMVLVETSFGGKRVMDQLVGDPLPRIC